MHPNQWIQIKPEGIYCVPGQFYIDPSRPVDYAIITHAHGDHARAGHHKVLATSATILIMKTRYGENSAQHFQTLGYHQSITHNQVKITFLPAGHILGSSQIELEYKGSRLIISGDYKRRYDPTCEHFYVKNCDVFITEATFGLPVFIHPTINNELTKLITSLQQFPARAHLVGAYALGKCQRVIMTLRELGYKETIYLHGAHIKLCELYQTLGLNLGSIGYASSLNKISSAGKIIICPPSALHDRWIRRFAEALVCNASGWMQIRARAKQKGIDLPLIISDHSDWNELTQTIDEINPQEVWVTHGREEGLVYYATQKGIKAQSLSLLGYDENEGET